MRWKWPENSSVAKNRAENFSDEQPHKMELFISSLILVDSGTNHKNDSLDFLFTSNVDLVCGITSTVDSDQNLMEV